MCDSDRPYQFRHAGPPQLSYTHRASLRHEQASYLTAGFDAALSKPIRRQELSRCLDQLLNENPLPARPSANLDSSNPIIETKPKCLPNDWLRALDIAAEKHRVVEVNHHLTQFRISEMGYLQREFVGKTTRSTTPD